MNETTEMNEMELNLIPLWEFVIERNFLTHINYNLINDKIPGTDIKHKSFSKLLLQFVPTVSPYYYYSLENKEGLSAEFLIEALKHSMNSVAIKNPKLFLELSSNNVVKIQDSDDVNNKVFINDIMIHIIPTQ